MTDLSLSSEVPVEASPSVDFRSLFEGHFSYVWNTLRRLGVREADLKDQTQEVFLTVHQLLADYDPARPLRPWLFGIAYRYAARYRALARHKYEVPEADDEPAGGGPLADEQVATRQRLDRVLKAIHTIELPLRAVFVMAEIDGHSIPDVAQALGIPLNTAYSRLRLARRDFDASVKRLRVRGEL
jgi:RNA polymerase sigma-70 factor, ECF subfamily